jgi:hypothetical protein
VIIRPSCSRRFLLASHPLDRSQHSAAALWREANEQLLKNADAALPA